MSTISFAQDPSLKIIPQSPTSLDNVVVVGIKAFFYGHKKIDSMIVVNGTDISLYACYGYGYGTAAQVTIDTVYYQIGPLNNGIYSVTYLVNSFHASQDSNCSGYTVKDTAFFSFVVGVNDIDKNTLQETLTLYWLTSHNLIEVVARPSLTNIILQLFTIDGRMVAEPIKIAEPTTTISIAHLPAGVYIAHLHSSNGQWQKKIVKY